MIAMQYNFVLPADYDMRIIERRIAEKGHFTDGLPGLMFKAYLNSRKEASSGPEGENCYAPFYLWDSTAGLNDFLSGPGFVAVSQSFGWPSVKTWPVWHAALTSRMASATIATRALVPIRPYTRLEALREAETRYARELVESHRALAAVAGFDPTTWNVLRMQLWGKVPSVALGGDISLYDVGHVSM